MKAALFACVAMAVVMLALIGRPPPEDAPVHVFDVHGAGMRWSPEVALDDGARHDDAFATALPAAMPDMLLYGEQQWKPLTPPTDPQSFHADIRGALAQPSTAALVRTAARIAVRGQSLHNASAGCRRGCSGRGRCDQLLRKPSPMAFL